MIGKNVLVPLEDLIDVAAIHLTVLDKRDVAIQIANQRSAQITELISVIELKDKKITNFMQAVTDLREENSLLHRDLSGANVRIAGLKPWATLGKVTVVIIVVAVVVGAVVIIQEAIAPG